MVLLQESCVEVMSQKQASWESLIAFDDSELKTSINQQTKTKMLLEYEEKTGKQGSKRHLSRIPLWYFLHEILELDRCKHLIVWENVDQLIFTIKKPKELAVLWGQVKNRETMTYAKLARGIRYYYGKGVIEKHHGKRFSYQFIMSKKTKCVLYKSHSARNIKEEEDISPFVTDSEEQKLEKPEKPKPTRKRKSSGNNLRVLKRSRSNTSTDSMDRSSVGSDDPSDNDTEFSNLDQWGGLESYLDEILTNGQKMNEILTDCFPGTDDSSFSNEALPNENESIKSEIIENSCSSSPVCSMVQCYNENLSSNYFDPLDAHYDNNNESELKFSPSGINAEFGELKFTDSIKDDNKNFMNSFSQQNSPQNVNADINPYMKNFAHEKLSRKKSKSESDCRYIMDNNVTIKLEPPTPQYLPCRKSVPDFPTSFSDFYQQNFFPSPLQLQHQPREDEVFQLSNDEQDELLKDLDSIIFDDMF